MAKTVAIEVDVKVGELEKRLAKVETALGKVKKQGKETSKEITSGFQAANQQAELIGGPVGRAVATMNSLKTATLKFVGTLKTVKTAIAATGIGLLVLAVASLIQYFTKSASGAQKLRVIMAAFGAAVDVVADRFISLGEAIALFFSGDWEEATKSLKNAFKDVGIEMMADAALAAKLAEDFNKLKVSTRELSVETAQARAEIKQLNKDAEDVTLSFEKRAEAAEKAGQIESDLLQRRLALAEENVRIIKAQNELGTSAEEDLQKLADAEISLAQIRMESLELQTTLQNKVNTIRLQQEAQRLAAEAKAEEDRKKAAEDELALLQKVQDSRIALIQNEENRRIAEVEMSLARKLEELVLEDELTQELRKNLEEIADQEIGTIRQEFKDKELAALEEQAKKKKDLEDKAVADVKAAEAAKKKLREDGLNAAGSALSSLGQLITASGNQSKEAVALQKTLAVAQIAIDTAKAITGAIAQAQSVPFPANLAAIAVGVAAVISGIASAVTTLNSADVGGTTAQPPPSPQTVSAPAIQQTATGTTELGGIDQANLAPIQAFVVETEVTGNQNNVNQIESQANFG